MFSKIEKVIIYKRTTSRKISATPHHTSQNFHQITPTLFPCPPITAGRYFTAVSVKFYSNYKHICADTKRLMRKVFCKFFSTLDHKSKIWQDHFHGIVLDLIMSKIMKAKH